MSDSNCAALVLITAAHSTIRLFVWYAVGKKKKITEPLHEDL